MLYRDIIVFRGKLSHAYDVMMAGRLQNRTFLMLPFSHFPPIPVKLACRLPPEGLSVRASLFAYFFATHAQSASKAVRIRSDVAFLIEWAHNVTTALVLGQDVHARVWKCSVAYIAFVEQFLSLGDFFVEAVSRFVVSVLFRSPTGQLVGSTSSRRRIYLRARITHRVLPLPGRFLTRQMAS